MFHTTFFCPAYGLWIIDYINLHDCVVTHEVNGWRCEGQALLEKSSERCSDNNLPKCMHI